VKLIEAVDEDAQTARPRANDSSAMALTSGTARQACDFPEPGALRRPTFEAFRFRILIAGRNRQKRSAINIGNRAELWPQMPYITGD
jgi:hypothetical protein